MKEKGSKDDINFFLELNYSFGTLVEQIGCKEPRFQGCAVTKKVISEVQKVHPKVYAV